MSKRQIQTTAHLDQATNSVASFTSPLTTPLNSPDNKATRNYSPRKPITEACRNLFSQDICIFCDQKTKAVNGKKYLAVGEFEDKGKVRGKVIDNMAIDPQDHGYSSFMWKVMGVDLITAKARFYQPYYCKFYSAHQSVKGYHRSDNKMAANEQKRIEDV